MTASLHDIEDYPWWLLQERLGPDVAAYILRLREKADVGGEDADELEEWRSLICHELTDPDDVQERLNEIDGIGQALSDLNAAAQAVRSAHKAFAKDADPCGCGPRSPGGPCARCKLDDAVRKMGKLLN